MFVCARSSGRHQTRTYALSGSRPLPLYAASTYSTQLLLSDYKTGYRRTVYADSKVRLLACIGSVVCGFSPYDTVVPCWPGGNPSWFLVQGGVLSTGWCAERGAAERKRVVQGGSLLVHVPDDVARACVLEIYIMIDMPPSCWSDIGTLE